MANLLPSAAAETRPSLVNAKTAASNRYCSCTWRVNSPDTRWSECLPRCGSGPPQPDSRSERWVHSSCSCWHIWCAVTWNYPQCRRRRPRGKPGCWCTWRHLGFQRTPDTWEGGRFSARLRVAEASCWISIFPALKDQRRLFGERAPHADHWRRR